MRIIRSVNEMKNTHFLGPVGFVPTMGALHEGHASLIRRSLEENQTTVVSIFVNPTQFNNSSDLKNYPSSVEKDVEILRNLDVDALFAPEFESVYPDGYRFQVRENKESLLLEGEHRPGHFDGVLTVVLKLFNIVRPQNVYMGEKDFQQFELIRDMANALFLDCKIIGCKTVREEDGLALSSRNVLLTETGRKKAKLFPQLLFSDMSDEEVFEELKENEIDVEYVVTRNKRRFGAIRIDDVRLIDNVEK